jgi:uncharacterized protein
MIVSSAEFPATAGAAPPTPSTFPNPLGYVSDYAGVLDEAWRARIRSVCRDLEKKTGVELVVVTTRDIAPYTGVRQYADALYKYWRIGTVQQEHGVLLLAYLERPQASVTLGRSMIRVISPTLLRQTTRRFVDPAFQAGQYGEGLYRTVVALSSASQDIRVGQPGGGFNGASSGLRVRAGSVATSGASEEPPRGRDMTEECGDGGSTHY